MSKQRPEQTEAARWKEKYLESLDEIDRSKEEFERSLESLKRGLLRISLAADGVDQHLDLYLNKLRRALRKGESASTIENLFGHIDGILRRLDETRHQRSDQFLSGIEEGLDQISQFAQERDTKKQIKQLERALAANIEPSGFGALFQQYFELQKLILEELSSDKPEENKDSGSFWGRFKKTSSSESQTSPETYDAPVITSESTPAVFTAEPELDDNAIISVPDIESVKERVSGVILANLDQCILTPDMKSREERIRLVIKEGYEWPEFPDTLSETFALVRGASGESQKGVETFLMSLNERLVDIHDFLKNNESQQLRSNQHSEALDHEIKQTISTIHKDMGEVKDGSQLKLKIGKQLDSVKKAISQYREELKGANEAVLNSIKALSQRLTSMEEEASELKETIRSQRELALKDALTELPNRQAYNDYIEKELARVMRHGSPLSMAVCDVDKFKQVNDNYGHLAGDKVLKVIAKVISQSLRKSDFIARFGGEEFVVLFPETDLEAAMTVAEKMRITVESCPFHFKEKRVPVTASFGVTQFAEGDSADSLFSRADKALYQAKRQGRNCVIVKDKNDNDELGQEPS